MFKIRQMPTAEGEKNIRAEGQGVCSYPRLHSKTLSLKHLLPSNIKEKRNPSPWLHRKIEVTCKANEFPRAQLKMVNN